MVHMLCHNPHLLKFSLHSSKSPSAMGKKKFLSKIWLLYFIQNDSVKKKKAFFNLRSAG